MPKRQRKTVLNSEVREFVVRLRDYFAREQQNGGPLLPLDNVRDRVADALGIGKATVSRITKEKFGESSMEDNKLLTPKKKKKRLCHITEPDDFDLDAIRNHIYGYYLRGELPTCQKLLSSLKAAELFKGGATSLRIVLKKCGFRYKKCDKRKILMERTDIALLRCDFLRKIKQIDNWEKVVYLDETWLNANHTVGKAWTDDTAKSSTKTPEGKGQRLIICHAGTATGFVPNCLWAFKSVKTTEYHEEMNFENFKTWFIKLLENLNEPHYILMDNASYHSVQINKPPSSNNKKAEIIEWLQRNGVETDSQMLKKELVRLLNFHKQQTHPSYFLDELAKSNGHTVIRLPPYHCQYNAIELIWAQIKGIYIFYLYNIMYMHIFLKIITKCTNIFRSCS